MINVEELCAKGIKEWRETKNCTSLKRWYMTDEQRQEYEMRLDEIVADNTSFMSAFPKYHSAQKRWKEKGISYLEAMLREPSFPLLDGMSEEVRELFQDITVSFLRDVRAFDRTLSLQDTMQALRNVWIIAILQCLFQKIVGYHPAMFAYSMLYPYSDNYLDDDSIAAADKQAFNQWFTARLHGESVMVKNEREMKISALVDMVEQQFPRERYPEVYESLYLIQAAQIRSLAQQDGDITHSMEELLRISFQKGGTSVVADGMLIDGHLSKSELHFCMQYGFMLQIGDDIQDGNADALRKHQTLISSRVIYEQDAIVTKLMQYTMDILKPGTVCKDERLLDFVLQDCLYLIFFALMKSDAVIISASLKQKIRQCLPVSSAYMEGKQIASCFPYTQKEWWERIDVLLNKD